MNCTGNQVEAEIMMQFAWECETRRHAFADGVIHGVRAAVECLSGFPEQVAVAHLMVSLQEQMKSAFTAPECSS